MKQFLIMACLLFAVSLFAADIIPVKVWPKTISTADKVISNPTVDQCVKCGYRLLADKPATPTGKKIKSEKIVQGDKPETCKYEITYEDIPVVVKPPYVPPTLVEVTADKVKFKFSTNGTFYGVVWTDAPKTNGIK